MTAQDRIVHKSPFPDWYATQDGSRGVWLCDRASDQRVKVEPPAEWGCRWWWNLTEDGTGIYFRREREPLRPETKVIRRQDRRAGTILNRVSPHEYEVMTDRGIEVWAEADIQAVEE